MDIDQQLEAAPAGPEEQSPDADNPVGAQCDLFALLGNGMPAGADDESRAAGAAQPAGAKPRRRWPLVTAYVTVAAVLLSATVVGVNTRHQVIRSQQTLQMTRAELRQTVTHIAAARATLASVTDQSAAVGTTLTTETSQLAGDQSQLAAAEANVHANGVSIADLDACLAGVEQALNQISLSDQAGAATTLDGVSASCQGAEPSG